MAKFNLFRRSDRKKAIDALRSAPLTITSGALDRAEEIAQEVYQEKFLGAIESIHSGSISGPIRQRRNIKGYKGSKNPLLLTLIFTERGKMFLGIKTKQIFVEVRPNAEGGEVYNILDKGVDKVPRRAADYGYKAWPIVAPRDQTLTNPDSIDFNLVESNEDVIFRPVIYNPILARNFTKHLVTEIQRRIDAENLGVKVTIRAD